MPNPTEAEKISFSNEIELIVEIKKTTYIDAIITYCFDMEIEESIAALLITESLKSKIETEAISLHQIKNTTTKLPF